MENTAFKNKNSTARHGHFLRKEIINLLGFIAGFGVVFFAYLVLRTQTLWKAGVSYLAVREVITEICANPRASGALGDFLLTSLKQHSETKSPASIFKSRK